MLHHAHRVVTIRKSRPSGKRKLIPSHDTLENPQNTHNRTASESPGKDQEAGKTRAKPQEIENRNKPRNRLFGGRGVLGDGLGTLRDGVLGQLTGEDEADGGLDLSGRDGGLLVVGGELGGLGGNALEDVC
jgi:hypothetical protein